MDLPLTQGHLVDYERMRRNKDNKLLFQQMYDMEKHSRILRATLEEAGNYLDEYWHIVKEAAPQALNEEGVGVEEGVAGAGG